ncbi:S1/P1 nuclease [Caulobacter sp. FWC26]|uniref:S1/P1 nuclease n=1 Tax=Caulobacter sp. FWC26 TaxID=69665 RepID=UPI000C14A78D|nr:S1/P1 nuclease [Caulobacter sp. FWC26]AZS21557.1 S1/P1 Nuclease [Caulobacter sp. FWC26]
MRARTCLGAAGLALLTALSFDAAPAAAWTRPGHMVIAAIAFDALEVRDPAVIDRVVAVLDSHPDRGAFEVAEDRSEGRERALRLMMECARWPDDARLTGYDQPSWHLELKPIVRTEDPPANAPAPDVAMDGVEAFALNARVMANRAATPAQRAVALCWVMHLAGDVHQPLHTAQLFSSQYPESDKAGSQQFVIDPVTGRPETLHWFWDDAVHRAGDIGSVRARAIELERRLPRTVLAPGVAHAVAANYSDWAEESRALAASRVYASGPVGGPSAKQAKALPPGYAEEAAAVAEARAALAGYRLSDLLREAFDR